MLTSRNNNSNRKRESSRIARTLGVGLLSVMLITSTAPAGMLLVRSYNGHDWDLYIVNEDGTNLRAIDTSPNNVCHGEFSPDGKTILYVAETTPPYYSIYQVSVHGGAPRVVPGFADVFSVSRPAWGALPDRFYCGVCVGGSCGNYDMEIHRLTYALDADGFLDQLIADEVIVSAKNVQFHDVDEYLNKIACDEVIPAACYSGNGTLVTYRADGTNRQVLAATQDGKSDACPIISPNGEYLLYYKSDSGWADPHNVYRIRWDGTGQQRLTSYAGQAAYPIWRDDDCIFYGVTPSMYSVNYVLHRKIISTGQDVVIPTDQPNCVPLDFAEISDVLLVEIDIKPGSYPNAINLGSFGSVPVAILSTEDFDATTVDPATVQFAGADVEVRGKGDRFMAHKEDVDGDGLVDLVLQIATQNLDPGTFQDGCAILTGATYSGQCIAGTDEITIVPPK